MTRHANSRRPAATSAAYANKAACTITFIASFQHPFRPSLSLTRLERKHNLAISFRAADAPFAADVVALLAKIGELEKSIKAKPSPALK